MGTRVATWMVMAGLLGRCLLAQTVPQAPDRMTYQGFLSGGDGLPLGNSAPRAYEIVFRIYSAESGGTLLWVEQQTVTVDKGYFSAQIGEGGPVTGFSNPPGGLASVFSGASASDRYVGVTIKGIGFSNADFDVVPRIRLLSAPFAYLAQSVQKFVSPDGTDLVSASAGGVAFSAGISALSASTPLASVGSITVSNGIVFGSSSGTGGDAPTAGGLAKTSEGSLRMISGQHRWSTNAAPGSGTNSVFATEPSPGYSIQRTGRGAYKVTFDTPFADVPAVVVTPLQIAVPNASNLSPMAWALVGRTTNTSEVTIYLYSYYLANGWSFFGYRAGGTFGNLQRYVNTDVYSMPFNNQDSVDWDFQFHAVGP